MKRMLIIPATNSVLFANCNEHWNSIHFVKIYNYTHLFSLKMIHKKLMQLALLCLMESKEMGGAKVVI